MNVKFVESKVGKFGEYPNPKPRRGRPRKKLFEKIGGSLVEENRAPHLLLRSMLQEFKYHDAYTIEYITTMDFSQVENFLSDRVAYLRNIINKKSRAYIGLDLSGLRSVDVRNLGGGVALVDLRIVCTTPAGAVFIASHLMEKFCSNAYRGVNFAVSAPRATAKIIGMRLGRLEMELGGRWSILEYLDEIIVRAPEDVKNFAITPKHFARVLHCCLRCLNPSSLRVGDVQIVKGAVGYCQVCDKDGNLTFNEPKVIYHGFRTAQRFGTLYNPKKRREEYHKAGTAEYWFL